jgi:hypothetical protein
MFGSQMRAQTVNLRVALATTQKGNLSVSDYVGKMKALGDDMAAAGRKLDDEELVEYILAGLGEEFTPVVSTVCARVEPINIGELYTQLLYFESRQELLYGGQHQASANAASHARGSWRGRGNPMRGCGPSHGGASQHGGAPRRGSGGYTRGTGRGSTSHNHHSYSDVPCQVCFKKNHTTAECWHKFDENYVPDQRFAGVAASYGVDTNWYADTGATDHITRELDKLTMKEKYTGEEQIHMASRSSMEISHIGHTTVYTPRRDIHLNNILYVPETTKNLVSIHRLVEDNCVFVEFHPCFFCIKDQDMRDILLRGKCQQGLYPLPSPGIMQAYNKSTMPPSLLCLNGIVV